eukprot:s2440_g5.t1
MPAYFELLFARRETGPKLSLEPKGPLNSPRFPLKRCFRTLAESWLLEKKAWEIKAPSRPLLQSSGVF